MADCCSAQKKGTLPICACHPCARAMLIFSVSFQFYRMIHSVRWFIRVGDRIVSRRTLLTIVLEKRIVIVKHLLICPRHCHFLFSHDICLSSLSVLTHDFTLFHQSFYSSCILRGSVVGVSSRGTEIDDLSTLERKTRLSFFPLLLWCESLQGLLNPGPSDHTSISDVGFL